MTGVKVHKYARPDSRVESNSVKLQEIDRLASGTTPSKDDGNQTDKWFIGFGAKESISVPRNAVPKPLLDTLKNPALTSEVLSKKGYDRSKFQITGLHAGDESRVEIALLVNGGGGGFADVMPGEDGFIITVPELFEFEGRSFSADEFLQAVNAAKAQFKIRSTSGATTASDGGAESS
jgi:hypothetical protein